MKLVKVPSRKSGTIRRTYCNEIQLIETFVESKVLLTSKALKLYTTLSLMSTTNCFALMFKQMLDKCMMHYDNCLRHFSKTLTN